MQTIINHIYQKSHLAYLRHDFLIFGLNEYSILVYFEGKLSRKNDIEVEDRYQELESSDIKSFHNRTIKRILISYGQNLSTRNMPKKSPPSTVMWQNFPLKRLSATRTARRPHCAQISLCVP